MLRRRMLEAYQPSSNKGRLLKTLIAFGWAGDSHGAAELPVTGISAQLQTLLGVSSVTLGYFVPVRSDHSKVTVIVADQGGKVRAFAKMACSRHALSSVRYERSVLAELRGNALLGDRIPEMNGEVTGGGHWGILLSSGPLRRAPLRFGACHTDFLNRLQATSLTERRFAASSGWRNCGQALQDIRNHLDARWQDRLAHVQRRLWQHTDSGQAIVHVSWAHRDFAPWNTRMTRSGELYVFDWEWARPEYPRLFDAVHFTVAPTILGLLSKRVMWDQLQSIVRASRVTAAEARATWAFYLLDMATTFIRLNVTDTETTDSRFIRSVGCFIDGIEEAEGLLSGSAVDQ